jgi:Domain of unknown function (DUF4919)
MRTNKQTANIATLMLCCLAILVSSYGARAENNSEVIVPTYDDKYSKLVKQLEAGQTQINYKEFRESFLESPQFKAVDRQTPDLGTLRKTIHELMLEKQYAELIRVTKKMLSIDYTDLEAHKVLQQTYKILGDVPNRNKYHDIEFGLLNSIVKNGDGKTCATAWPVIQVAEEYFILEMIGAKLLKQTIEPTGPCDKMEGEVEGGAKTFYFGVSKVFEGYKERGIK